MVQDGAPNKRLLLLAASALLLERMKGESPSSDSLFHLILQDLTFEIARSGFKWCSPVLSTGSVAHHQVVWKYPFLVSVLLGDRCDGSSWSLTGTASAAALPRKHRCSPAWPGMGWEVEFLLLFRAKQRWKLQNSEFATISLG